MEKFELACENAKKDLKIADHMINVTYKLVNDPKMLLTIMQRLMNALTNTISCVLSYERMYKRIPLYSDDFESMFSMFKARCTRRYNINIEYLTIVEEVREILKSHTQSPVEFSRKDQFVICSENYRMRVISIDKIKNYINKAKMFQLDAEKMVRINGRNNA